MLVNINFSPGISNILFGLFLKNQRPDCSDFDVSAIWSFCITEVMFAKILKKGVEKYVYGGWF